MVSAESVSTVSGDACRVEKVQDMKRWRGRGLVDGGGEWVLCSSDGGWSVGRWRC